MHADLEELLAEKYALRDVSSSTSRAGRDVTSALGSGAAAYLDATLHRRRCHRRLVVELDPAGRGRGDAPQAHPGRGQVVQLVGGVGSPEVQMQATRLTGRLAEVTGASPVFVPSPGLVGSTALQQALMADPGVQAVQAQWTRAHVALVGIGTLEPSPLLRRSGNSLARERAGGAAPRGAVGDVCLRYFDAQASRSILLRPTRHRDRSCGHHGGSPPHRRCRRSEKTAAIRAAVLGGWINILITDLDVATILAAD